MRLQAPQIIYVVLTFAGMLITAHNHGKPRADENFWTSLVATIIVYSLLAWGGFFG
jgi:hypothetical protein